jgi:hypothetical protein
MSNANSVIDVVDVTDPSLMHTVRDLETTGSIVLVLGGMCGGVAQMVNMIIRSAFLGCIDVLRIWSHGDIAKQSVSCGQDGEHFVKERAGIWNGNIKELTPILEKLRPYFAQGARVELRGCAVGRGYDGDDFLKKLARLWGVTIHAPVELQPISGLSWFGMVKRVTPAGSVYPGSGEPVRAVGR